MQRTLKPILDRKIRFALVGCGRIAKNHVSALDQLSHDCELVDICDVNAAALGSLSQKVKANHHENISDMLHKTTADCVILTTPSGLHPEQTILAAQSMKHVITEKPMALHLNDGLQMVEACQNAEVTLFVVKQNRHNPTLEKLKRAIINDRFGRICSVAVNVFWTRPQEYYDSATWRGTWKFDGGALMNQASHYVDLLDWLIGPVESVMAYTGTLLRDIEVEDSAAVALNWKNGALGTINVSMLTHPKNLEGSITIIGETGTVKVGGIALNEILHWEFANHEVEDAEVQNVNYEARNVYGNGHFRYYNKVIDFLRGKKVVVTDGGEGLKSLELLIAMYSSATHGRRVFLPLEN